MANMTGMNGMAGMNGMQNTTMGAMDMATTTSAADP